MSSFPELTNKLEVAESHLPENPDKALSELWEITERFDSIELPQRAPSLTNEPVSNYARRAEIADTSGEKKTVIQAGLARARYKLGKC